MNMAAMQLKLMNSSSPAPFGDRGFLYALGEADVRVNCILIPTGLSELFFTVAI